MMWDLDFGDDLKLGLVWAIVIAWGLTVLGAFSGALYIVGRIVWGLL